MTPSRSEDHNLILFALLNDVEYWSHEYFGPLAAAEPMGCTEVRKNYAHDASKAALGPPPARERQSSTPGGAQSSLKLRLTITHGCSLWLCAATRCGIRLGPGASRRGRHAVAGVQSAGKDGAGERCRRPLGAAQRDRVRGV